jgi:FHA domain
MPTCANGHDSTDDEFCEVCGLAFASPTPAPTEAGPPEPMAAKHCPVCGAELAGRFCEDCGADSLAEPPPAAEAQPVAEEPVEVGKNWSVVVSADREYYETVKAAGGPDADSISFPPYCPDRHFRLPGEQVSIGRRSQSRGIHPDIDLTGPPEDAGVSRLHALLVAGPDGRWSIVDVGSANGTFLNEDREALPVNVARPLAEGDRIHVGAWTTITLRAKG